MGESRTELLAWLNDLLQVNYTKVEQCGAGGAYCQIIDSIYGQFPCSKCWPDGRLVTSIGPWCLEQVTYQWLESR